MNIQFKTLALENFKNHQSLEVELGDINKIDGRNGAGKSSIGEAVTWLLYGVDMLGNKLDPTPIGADEETETSVQLMFQSGDKDILLGRSSKKGKAKYYINEVPEKATKFNEVVDSLFDKNLFLSLFNPSYFSTQHWQDQRSQLLQYVPEPINKEVLAAMSKVDRDNLEHSLKRHSLDDLEKLHREQFRKKDKESERTGERVKTLEEQLQQMQTDYELDEEAITGQIKQLENALKVAADQNKKVKQAENERFQIETKMGSIKQQMKKTKADMDAIKQEQIKENCDTCGQPLDDESIQKVKDSKQKRFDGLVSEGQKLAVQFKELKSQYDQLPASGEETDTAELQSKIYDLKTKLEASSRVVKLQSDIELAKNDKEQVHKDRGESLGIVDAIKAFRTKRAELMVQKVDELFTNISVRLFEQQKNGDMKATFEIEMDGKPYSKLSTAEKIKAGLELIEVISKQSEVISPSFIDNAESVLNFTAPSGQLIVSRVKDADLNIETESIKSQEEAS